MPRYTVNWDYGSSLGTFAAGETVALDEELADHVNRSSPGVLTPVDDHPEANARSLEKPPSDRMVRGPRRKRDGGS